MKVIVDRDRCLGNGLCEAVHPAVFELADDGIVVAHNENIRADERARVEEAVAVCPARALRIVEAD